MEQINTAGIHIIEQIQNSLFQYQNPLMLISYFGDPKFAYTVHFPFIFAISQLCGMRLIYSAAVGECLNLVLKWLIQEGRPYWYIQENSDTFGNLTLHQFPITCETGPGSPSGHVMISTAFWFVAIAAASFKLNTIGSVLLKLLYIGGIFLIALSRMFLAAHFPHQCILGFIIGVIFGYFCTCLSASDLSPKKLTLTSVGMLLLTLGTFWFLLLIDQHPNQSIEFALKWCVKREYVHLDTTPLFCSMRYTGMIFGCGVGTIQSKWEKTWSRRSWLAPFLLAVFNILVSQAVIHCPMPGHALIAYVFSFVVHALLAICLVRIGPEIISRLLPVTVDDKKKKY